MGKKIRVTDTDYVDKETGEIIYTEKKVYSLSDERFFMLMLTQDNGEWIKSISLSFYVLVLILNKQALNGEYCNLSPEDRDDICKSSSLSMRQVNRIIKELEKKNFLKFVSRYRLVVNPRLLSYGKTSDLKKKYQTYENID